MAVSRHDSLCYWWFCFCVSLQSCVSLLRLPPPLMLQRPLCRGFLLYSCNVPLRLCVRQPGAPHPQARQEADGHLEPGPGSLVPYFFLVRHAYNIPPPVLSIDSDGPGDPDQIFPLPGFMVSPLAFQERTSEHFSPWQPRHNVVYPRVSGPWLSCDYCNRGSHLHAGR